MKQYKDKKSKYRFVSCMQFEKKPYFDTFNGYLKPEL